MTKEIEGERIFFLNKGKKINMFEPEFAGVYRRAPQPFARFMFI